MLDSSAERALAPAKQVLAQELPKQPLPGQLKPDAKGRCPTRLIAINGGCWAKVDVAPKDCPENMFVHQGVYYLPLFSREHVPTSASQER